MNYPKLFIKQGIEQISPSLFKVGEHSVKIQKKKGRTLLLCDCDNASYFGHNQFCIHKECVIVFKNNKDAYKAIDKLIKDYNLYKLNKLKPSNDLFLDELNKLKDLI